MKKWEPLNFTPDISIFEEGQKVQDKESSSYQMRILRRGEQ